MTSECYKTRQTSNDDDHDRRQRTKQYWPIRRASSKSDFNDLKSQNELRSTVLVHVVDIMLQDQRQPTTPRHPRRNYCNLPP